MKEEIPEIKKIHYFSDGCPNQYKCRQNFVNLKHHKGDFDIECEWNFFATSHGKGPCDGIGGTIKREATKASLRRPNKNHIQTPEDLFIFTKTHLSGIKTYFVSDVEIRSVYEQYLEERFLSAKTLKGRKKFHCFKPTNGKMICKLTSFDEKLQTHRI